MVQVQVCGLRNVPDLKAEWNCWKVWIMTPQIQHKCGLSLGRKKKVNPDKLSVASEQTNPTGSRITLLRASVCHWCAVDHTPTAEMNFADSFFSHHSATCVSKLRYLKSYLEFLQKGIISHR